MFDSSPNSWIPDMVDFFTPREKSNNSFSKKVLKEKGKSRLSVENINSNFNNDNENSITTISNRTGSKNKRKRESSTGKSEESFNVQKKRRKLQSVEVTNTPFGSEGKNKKKRKSKNNDFSSQSIEQEIVNESFKNEEMVSFESPKKKKKKKHKSLENISITSRNIKQEIKNGSIGEEGSKSTHSVEKKKMKNKKTKISNVINESNSKESEEQDDDSTVTKKSKKKLAKKITRQGSMQPDDAQKSRTVFFGNLPNTWTKDRFLKKISKRYGKLEMSTFKFKPVKQKDSENKVAENKPEILYAVVRFVNKSSAVKAVNDNGIVFSDHHIRINMAHEDIVQDRNKSVFVGNVPRTTSEDELWQLFESCGKIRSIRILRDAYTGNSKNVAYVNFESTDSVELALKLDGETLKERELRVQRCMTRERKRKEKRRNKKLRTSTESTLQQKKKKSPDSMTTFQGETSSKKQKKKKKLNKEEIRKRILMKKLAPTMKQTHKMKLKSV